MIKPKHAHYSRLEERIHYAKVPQINQKLETESLFHIAELQLGK